MSKVSDILQEQQNNPNSALNNFLNGKPIATYDFGMDNKTIIKLSVSILALGVALMAINKYILNKNQ
jgi:hypothetical protein